MTVDNFDEELRELGRYLPAEDPDEQEAIYGLAEAAVKRTHNLTRLGEALENDRFKRAQGLYR